MVLIYSVRDSTLIRLELVLIVAILGWLCLGHCETSTASSLMNKRCATLNQDQRGSTNSFAVTLRYRDTGRIPGK